MLFTTTADNIFIELNYQVLFSLKDNNKKIRLLSATIFLSTLRAKEYLVIVLSFSGEIEITVIELLSDTPPKFTVSQI